ncbi:Mobile element protein [Geobacillus proteiniphilus]|uniref:Mobile element protein n=1 Tax=Geobacillus proteiniphilus TaxID=860353 RepID=A0A1Q5SI92_9BACL|nr:Mobile element protein [Geobacillus proteiniphilus]
MTSNLEFGQWNRVFGDNRLTAALVDRLVHHAHILAFTGESYRSGLVPVTARNLSKYW